MIHVTALTEIGNFGQAVKAFCVTADKKFSPLPNPSDFSVTNAWLRFPGAGKKSVGIISVEETEDGLILNTDGFLYGPDFRVDGPVSFTRDDIDDVKTAGADDFEAVERNGIRYRLYTPAVPGRRPLILFLHGGGEAGTDNLKQLTGCLGAVKLRERFPACYVMAPQAPAPEALNAASAENSAPMTPMESLTLTNERPFHYPDRFSSSDFSHEMLACVEYEIRDMIAKGLVDPRRIYVTGMSMGGAGALRMITVAKDLFAACVPICPFVDDEIYYDLAHCSIPVWLSLPYLDHVLERPMYLAHGMIACKENGNKNAHMTIYSPQELEACGIGADPDTPLTVKLSQNHQAWILTYNNAYGILDWMMNQIRED